MGKKKKSALQKKKDNCNSLYWQRKALAVWRDICLIKYGRKCLICSSTEHLEAHHPISKKTCKAIMYNTANQILLCTYHHNFFGTEQYRFSAHKAPLQFYHHLQQHHSKLYSDILSIDIEQEKQQTLSTRDYYEALLQIKGGLEKTL